MFKKLMALYLNDGERNEMNNLKLKFPIVGLLLGLLSFGVHAQDQVIESWTCQYHAGKGLKDLLGARDYMVKQADKAGIDLGSQFVWSLAKGDLGFDFVWQAPHDSGQAFAARLDAMGAAPEMAGVNARFDDVGDCTARLGGFEILHRRGAVSNPDAYVIAGLACRAKPDIGPADVSDLEAHIVRVRESLGDKAPLLTAAIKPRTRGPNGSNWILFSLFDNFSEQMAFQNTISSSETTQSLDRHFRTKMDCNFALWRAQQVIGPQG